MISVAASRKFSTVLGGGMAVAKRILRVSPFAAGFDHVLPAHRLDSRKAIQVEAREPHFGASLHFQDCAERKAFSPHSSSQCEQPIVSAKVVSGEKVLVQWEDGALGEFHSLWLRDCCRCSQCFHPQALERVVDTVNIPLDVHPVNLSINEDGFLSITWDRGQNYHTSTFDADWLRDNCYSFVRVSDEQAVQDALSGKVDPIPWGSEIGSNLPKLRWDNIMEDDKGLLSFVTTVQRYGFAVLENVPIESGNSVKLAKRIGFPRETFWGTDWAVKSEIQPANLSLTGAPLHGHTDFSWSKQPPGLQFLHCLKFDGGPEVGGESTLMDGKKVCDVLKRERPDYFHLLATVPISFQFASADLLYEHSAPMIEVDSSGNVVGVRHNHANRGPINAPGHLMKDMYAAIQYFSLLLRDARYELRFRLQAGDLLVFDNKRLLHGRCGYDPTQTSRHLEGCYVDIDEFESVSRVVQSRIANRSSQKVQGLPAIDGAVPTLR